MTKRRHVPRQPPPGGSHSHRDQETSRLANELLAAQDVVALRKLAAIRGLVSNGLRSRVWPLLLGVHDQPHDPGEYAALHAAPHHDVHVVDCDLERSLWNLTAGWPEGARAEKRAALRRVLNAAVGGNAGGVFYYQGLHDVAAVLLFVCGEAGAHRMLRRLAACHLRDCTRPALAAAVEVLALLYPILQAADPELHAYLTGLNEPALDVPHFALSWYMTWFAHDVPSLDQCARLFDLFISSHPLMPLYVAAVAVRGARDAVLACGADGDVAYATLKRMRFLQPGQPTADELARQAAALYRAFPPASLARRHGVRLQHSSTLDARLVDGRWRVPDQPSATRERFAQTRLKELVPTLWRSGAPLAALAAVLVAGAGSALLGAALLLVQLDVVQLGRPYS